MDTFDSIARANPEYVDALCRRYREDPRSVDENWALVHAGYDFALAGWPRVVDCAPFRGFEPASLRDLASAPGET